MSRQKIQRCFTCDSPTGRCEDDSLYVGDDGPLCEDCYEEHLDAIAELEKEERETRVQDVLKRYDADFRALAQTEREERREMIQESAERVAEWSPQKVKAAYGSAETLEAAKQRLRKQEPKP